MKTKFSIYPWVGDFSRLVLPFACFRKGEEYK